MNEPKIEVHVAWAPGQYRETDLIEESEDGQLAQPPAEGPSLPGPCLRRLSMARGECGTQFGTCPGLQRDGSCLSDIVREAWATKEKWAFEIDSDGYWGLKT